MRGKCRVIGENLVEISEIPVNKWTKDYKQGLEELMMSENNSNKEPEIEDIKEYHAGNRVHFVVKVAANKMAEL